MVHTNVNGSLKGPYQEVKKDKLTVNNQKSSSQVKTTSKDDKYGAWGPVYKSKQNFIDMHFS